MQEPARPPPDEELLDPHSPEEDDDVALDGSPQVSAANAALLALARAARSFLIYDASNNAIRSFLEALREKMMAALALGPLALAIRPFEMVLHREVVYVERRRDRSLAFRLFRDGVRGLVIKPAIPWEELLKLLEILSIRYTGVRQQEDDVVTLLWKAGFDFIEIEAIEGFVPDEETTPESGEEGGHGAIGGGVSGSAEPGEGHARIELAEMPRDWDRPFPTIRRAPLPLAWSPPSEAELERIAHECSSQALPADALRLVSEMVRLATDPRDPTTWDEVKPLAEEVRDFFLADGQVGNLVALLDLLGAAGPELARIRASVVSEQALRRIIHRTSRGGQEVPEELRELVRRMGGDPVAVLVPILLQEESDAGRRHARQLLLPYVAERAKDVLARMREARADGIRELLRLLQEAAPETAIDAALEHCQHPDLDVVFECARVLERAPSNESNNSALIKLLSSPVEAVRVVAIAGLVARKEQRAAPSFVQRAEKPKAPLSESEAELLGAGLARISQRIALKTFERWVQSGALLDRVGFTTESQALHLRMAMAGLGQIPGETAELLLKAAIARTTDELRAFGRQTQVRRRRLFRET